MNGGRDAAVPHTNPAAATADRSVGRLARKNRPACVTRSRPRVVTRTGPSCTAPRSRKVVGQTGPGAKGTERTKHGAEAVVDGVALSDGMVLGEGGGGLFVVPERDHHGAPNSRGAFAGERDGDRRIEPSQSGDVRGCWAAFSSCRQTTSGLAAFSQRNRSGSRLFTLLILKVAIFMRARRLHRTQPVSMSLCREGGVDLTATGGSAAADDALGQTIQLRAALKAAADMNSELTIRPGQVLVGGFGGGYLRLLRHRLELLGLVTVVICFCCHCTADWRQFGPDCLIKNR